MFSAFFKAQDYFGYQIHISYKDNSEIYRTTHTGIISFLLNCFLGWIIYYQIHDSIINKNNTSQNASVLEIGTDVVVQNLNRIKY